MKIYSSCELRWLQRCFSKASTSPLRARLLALPWNRPFFPAPFPWSNSNTLESKHTDIVPTYIKILTVEAT